MRSSITRKQIGQKWKRWNRNFIYPGMKGKFKFEDMRLEDIMAKLNRWYDCTVTYTDDSLRDLRFTGAAEKDRSASYLLELIEMITEVKFEIDGKNIIIKHK